MDSESSGVDEEEKSNTETPPITVDQSYHYTEEDR